MKRPTQEFWIAHYMDKPGAVKQGINNCTFITYETGGQIFGLCFSGKKSREDWHFRFRNTADLETRIANTVQAHKGHADMIAARELERKEYRHTLQVGAVIVASWGWEQTNIDFYQVMEVKPKSVVIREIESEIMEMTGDMSAKVIPVKDKFTNEPPMEKRVLQGNCIKFASYKYGYLWEGKPEYSSWYA